MHRTHLIIAGLAATGLIFSAACSSSDEPPPSTNDESGLGLPPKAGPEKPPPADAAAKVFAVNKLYLGLSDRDGSANQVNGWKQYGFNLDGKVSTETSTGLCKPRTGGTPKQSYPDGEQGVDNSFGKIIATLGKVLPTLESTVNDAVLEGRFTIMVHIDHLGPDAEYNPLDARLYGGKSLEQAPKFDGSDVWPVIPELLDDPKDISSSKIKFRSSYLIDNTWVSGEKQSIGLSLAIGGINLNLTIGSALMAMKLDKEHKTATQGALGGVLETAVLLEEIKKVAGALNSDFCGEDNPLIAQIEGLITQYSDIMKDGSQDPTKECDGISIGLGFDMAEVQLGPVGEPADVSGDPCAEGGGGAGGEGGAGGAGGSDGGAGGAGGK